MFRINDFSVSNPEKSFNSLIAQDHPDTDPSHHEDRGQVVNEESAVLRVQIKPSDCRLLVNNAIVSSLLPMGVEPVELRTKHETWEREILRFLHAVNDAIVRRIAES